MKKQKLSLSQILEENDTQQLYKDSVMHMQGMYKSPRDFADWDDYLKFCARIGSEQTLAATIISKEQGFGITAELCRQALVKKAPARYIGKELCEAFVRTPVQKLGADILNVFPYLHILLPRGIKDKDGDDIEALIVKCGVLHPALTEEQMKESQKLADVVNGKIAPPELQGAKGIAVASISASGGYYWNRYVDESARDWYQENILNGVEEKLDLSTNEIIGRIAVNALLVHLYEPELITTDSKASALAGKGFASKGEKDPLPATWIGKTFRYQRERIKKEVKGESEKAVRAHWRRGHWHTVLCGKGRSERKVQWYKPVYVGK